MPFLCRLVNILTTLSGLIFSTRRYTQSHHFCVYLRYFSCVWCVSHASQLRVTRNTHLTFGWFVPYTWLFNIKTRFAKGVFYTHPILQAWRTVSKDIQTWNFLHLLTYVGTHCCPNFKAMAVFNVKLWVVKVSKVDVCGRPLFANPVIFCLHCMHIILLGTWVELWMNGPCLSELSKHM